MLCMRRLSAPSNQMIVCICFAGAGGRGGRQSPEQRRRAGVRGITGGGSCRVQRRSALRGEGVAAGDCIQKIRGTFDANSKCGSSPRLKVRDFCPRPKLRMFLHLTFESAVLSRHSLNPFVSCGDWNLSIIQQRYRALHVAVEMPSGKD